MANLFRFEFMAKLLNANYEDDEAEKPSPAQIVASIDDLLIEIIQRLPLKHTVQLRLISKYWSSLILDPKISLLRIRPAVGFIFEVLNKGHSYIIFFDKSISSPIRKMTPTTNDTFNCHYNVISSCNGLLLCFIYRAGPKYYVCNPTTGIYIALPQVVFDNTNESICGMYLAFDPSKSPHYKVVCVLRCLRGWLRSFEVYSSETGTWRKGGELFTANVNFNYHGGVYWNGAIHWVKIVTKPQECVYFSLDCDDQTPKVFPNPPLQDDKSYQRSDYYFGESCDHLHFVDAHRELDEFIVYEMKRDYSEWFVKFKVNVLAMKGGFSEWYIKRKINASEVDMNYWLSYFKYKVFVRVHTVVRGENDTDSFLVVATGRRRIARYNIEQRTCETLCDFDSKYKDNSVVFFCSGRSFQYIESLCSV
ncbi:hypothetical protein CASFOL_006804 [Castilleja foliolosa]|uniref:F-box domain-containing protein n=1 Tax=Castilleja foliolosa TaxID=1961234 RepID=A0ABD3E8D7_9LAMI